MKLGLGLAYWGLGFTANDQLRLTQRAEHLGFDSVWISEGYGSDVVSIAGWLAAQTNSIRLGTAVMQIPARPPTTTAMSVATLDVLSGGRIQLGLGLSGHQVSEGWYGVEYRRPLQRTREYIEVVRMALARDRVDYHGSIVQLPLPGGLGRSLKLTIKPEQEQIPILLGAIGPKNVALAGEIADGWLPSFFSPEHVVSLRDPFDAGALAAGRDPAALRICPLVFCCIDDDIVAARNALRFVLTLYVGGMGSRNNNVYNSLMAQYGYAAEAQRIQDMYLNGHKREAEAALPDEFIDLVSLCGPVDHVAKRLATFEWAGVDTLIASPQVREPGQHEKQLVLLAAAGAKYLHSNRKAPL